MDNIKIVIHKLFDQFHTKESGRQEKIQRLWQSIIDPGAIRHTKLIDFKEGNLIVHIDSAAWLYQMNLKKTKILKAIQEDIPEIQQITYKIGKVD